MNNGFGAGICWQDSLNGPEGGKQLKLTPNNERVLWKGVGALPSRLPPTSFLPILSD